MLAVLRGAVRRTLILLGILEFWLTFFKDHSDDSDELVSHVLPAIRGAIESMACGVNAPVACKREKL